MSIELINQVKSAFTIQNADDFWGNQDTTCAGNPEIWDRSKDFIDAGYTKFTCVYGILIAGDANYPDNNLLYAANVLAVLLDQDCKSDCENIKPVRDHLYKYWLNGGSTQAQEQRGDAIARLNGFGLQNWKS